MSYTHPLEGFKPSLFSKIAEVQGKVGAIEPDQTMQVPGRGDYHYISESKLLSTIRPLLAERKVAAFLSVDTQSGEVVSVTKRDGTPGSLTRASVSTSITFADGESGEMFTVRGQGQGSDGGDKAIYKAITSACRYMWWKAMLVGTDGEDAAVSPDSGGVGESAVSGAARAPFQGEPEHPPNEPSFVAPAPREQPTDGGDPLKVVITFSKKHKGKTIGEVLDADPGFLRWMIDPAQFEAKTAETRRIVGAASIALGMAVPVPEGDGDFAPPHGDEDLPF